MSTYCRWSARPMASSTYTKMLLGHDYMAGMLLLGRPFPLEQSSCSRRYASIPGGCWSFNGGRFKGLYFDSDLDLSENASFVCGMTVGPVKSNFRQNCSWSQSIE
ncbi:hypothetical protein OROMI_032451 [Orobanche minor]